MRRRMSSSTIIQMKNNPLSPEKTMFNVKWWIKKYGVIEGPKLWKEWQIKQASKPGTSWSMKNLIAKYGEEEAKIRFAEYKEKIRNGYEVKS